MNNGGITRTYVSDGDENGVIYYLGTEEGTNPVFSNPETLDYIDVFYNVDETNKLTTNSVTNRSSVSISMSANSSNFIFDFKKDNYLLLQRLSFRISSSLGQVGNTGNFVVRVAANEEDARTGANGAETLINVDPTTLNWSTNTWFNYDFTPVGSYRYVYIRYSSQIIIDEVEFYGEVNPAPLSYNLVSEDEKGTIAIPPVTKAAVVLPTGLPQGFSVFIQNRGNTTTTLSSDGSSSVIGDSIIYNQGDLIVVTNIGSDTWISSNLSSIQSQNKGDISVFADKPTVLPIGTPGQVLTVHGPSAEGMRWENRADASDLIYAKEIPTQILGNYNVNDIFEYIGRNKDITFTNTFTNPSDGVRIVTNTNSTFGSGFDVDENLTNQTNISGSVRLGFNQFVSWQFNTVTIQPYYVGVLTRSSNNDADWDVEVSNNGTTWISAGTLPLNESNPLDWVVAELNVQGYYSYMRFRNTAGVGLDEPYIDEVKLFGWVKDNPTIGEIFAVGSTGITPFTGSDGSFLMADSTAPLGVRFAPSTGFVELLVPDSAVDRSVNNGSTFSIQNDLIDYLTTQAGGDPNGISINVGASFGASDASTTIDQNTGNLTGFLISEASDDELYVEFIGGSVAATEINLLTFGGNQDVLIQGTNDATGTTWNTLFTWDTTASTTNRAIEAAITDNTPYKYFRFTYDPSTGTGNHNIKEIGFYGVYQLDGTVVKAVDSININRVNYFSVPNNSNLQIDVPTGNFSEGDYFAIYNTGDGTVSLNSFLGVNIPNEQDAIGARGFVITHTDVTNTWIVTSVIGTENSHTKITTDEVTLTTTKTLSTTDASVQVINPGGNTRDVVLPDPPEKDLYFKIVNADAANFNLDIKETAAGTVAKTLDIDTPYVECHYTGTQWILT